MVDAGSSPAGDIMKSGDIVEVYSDMLPWCHPCIGQVEKIVGCFVLFRVIEIQNSDFWNAQPTRAAKIITSGEIRGAIMEDVKVIQQ